MPPEPRIPDEILTYGFPAAENPFTELFASVRWEDVGKGRRGAVLTKSDEAGGVPLVRTTTRYRNPAQRFGTVHERLARQVQEHAALPVAFNNALIECYTSAYTTMGSHSDQALDLADGSFIAVFSCYERPEVGLPRQLIIESKGSGGERYEIPLAHNTVVAFSLDTNRRFRHKIVWDGSARAADNQWLGVTFRTSKTLVRFDDGQVQLPQGARLVVADEEQRREFYRLRRRENEETDFVYPPLTYTVSESDLLPPL
ncbi:MULTISPECIES: alpha-ketoglutarate-dependent dioxygenase AlkB [unclassified Streptomyces]|uniref:alpha-ketoglutarate-dependent dioxygenase AlkB n=1 Tax=unclassified Streptomyces TaxID=2593676 RepID=UPI0036ECCFF3